jgi:hypothetical protein
LLIGARVSPTSALGLQVRPPAPIAWKANGATTLVNGGFSKYELGGSLANPPDDPEGTQTPTCSVKYHDLFVRSLSWQMIVLLFTGELTPKPLGLLAGNNEVLYGVPWWDDNLEFAPTHPPQEDMWENWNLVSHSHSAPAACCLRASRVLPLWHSHLTAGFCCL